MYLIPFIYSYYIFNTFYLPYLVYLNKLVFCINYMNNIMIIILSHQVPLRKLC